MRRKIDDLGRVCIPIEWRKEIGIHQPGSVVVMRKTPDGRGVELRGARTIDEQPRFTEEELLTLVARATARVAPDKQTALGAAIAAEIRRVVPEADDQA